MEETSRSATIGACWFPCVETLALRSQAISMMLWMSIIMGRDAHRRFSPASQGGLVRCLLSQFKISLPLTFSESYFCVYMWGATRSVERSEDNLWTLVLFPKRGFWRPNSDHDVCPKVLLPGEPSHWPAFYLFFFSMDLIWNRKNPVKQSWWGWNGSFGLLSPPWSTLIH